MNDENILDQLMSYEESKKLDPLADLRKDMDPLEKKKHQIDQSLKTIAFACGDSYNPREETLQILKVFLDEFIRSLTIRAHHRSKFAGANKVRLRQLLICLQHNQTQYLRAAQILDFLARYKQMRKTMMGDEVEK